MANFNRVHDIYIILVVCCTLLCSACADPRHFKEVKEEIQEYYNRFHSYYGFNPYFVSAGFVETIEGDENIVGACRSWSTGWREIWIEIDYWNILNDYGREQLVFHELGHCVFNRDHDNSEFLDGCPASMMNEYAFGESHCYSDHHDKLIDELDNSTDSNTHMKEEYYHVWETRVNDR